jgi:hypothetical protein
MTARPTRLVFPVLLLVFAMAVAFGGCGGSSGTSETANGASVSEFVDPSDPSKFAEFGHVANSEEREAASEVLEQNLAARQAGAWAEQCSSLTIGAIHEVELIFGHAKGCAKALRKTAEPLKETAQSRTDTLSGPISVLVIKGERAYALYHGNDGKDYSIPMRMEEGVWKVGSLVTLEVE